MVIQSQSNNQNNIDSSKNDELQSISEMKLFEIEFERTENQINHLEKVFKSHLTIISNLRVGNENKETF